MTYIDNYKPNRKKTDAAIQRWKKRIYLRLISSDATKRWLLGLIWCERYEYLWGTISHNLK